MEDNKESKLVELAEKIFAKLLELYSKDDFLVHKVEIETLNQTLSIIVHRLS